MRSFLRPHLVAAAGVGRTFAARGIGCLCSPSRVARRAFDGDAARLCDWLGMPEAHARWIVLDPGEPDVVLSRLDAFLTPDGPRFIEINSDAPAGFGYGDRMAEVVRELPRVPGVRRAASRGLRALSRTASSRRWCARGGRARRRSASPSWRSSTGPTSRPAPTRRSCGDAFEARGVRCLLADPRDWWCATAAVRVRRGAIDVVYRRGVLSELVEREARCAAFLEAYRDGARRLRQLVPLPALGGQGLLRAPDRRGLRGRS